MTRSDGFGTVLTFLVGAAVGATTALLFAPKGGEELRADIAESANDGIDEARSSVKRLKKRANQAIDTARDQFQDAVDAGQKAYGRAHSSPNDE